MFNFEELNLRESYLDKIGYAGQYLEFIGSGSSRHFFAIDDSKILKLASNEDGIIQNNVEKFYSDSQWERLIKVFDWEDDFMWLVSERTAPIETRDFETLLGISTEDLYVHLYHHKENITFEEDSKDRPLADCISKMLEMKNKTKNVPIVIELITKSNEFGFNTAHIPKIENWGLRKTVDGDFPVIIDYGKFDKRFRKFPLKNQS